MAKPRTTGVKKLKKLRRIYEAVCNADGIRAFAISRQLSMPNSSVYSAIPSMDLADLLLYEDERGMLYPFREIDRQDSEKLYAQTRR